MVVQILGHGYQALAEENGAPDPFLNEQVPLLSLRGRIEVYFRRKVISSFYAGYRVHSPEIAKARRDELFADYNAEEIRCRNGEIDAVILKSQSDSRTGNILVVCLNTTYQDRHPKHWALFLENGADVVLWNPTQLGPKAYSQDLGSVLNALRESNPDQRPCSEQA